MYDWMICLQTLAKQHLGLDILGYQTKFGIDLYMTLTFQVKLLNLATNEIAITLLVTDRFD